MQITTPKPVRPVIPVTTVKSSSIEGHGYDPVTKTLQVNFKGNKPYQYDNVPPELVASLIKAESAGKFVGANIVGKFKTHKLELPK